MPDINTPEIFGLHPNAEISYFTNAAKGVWANLLAMQTTSAQTASGVNREEYVGKVGQEILSKLPNEFDVRELRKKFGDKPSPTQIVLMQELERFNILINTIGISLQNLQRALMGEIGMSSNLDDLAFSLFNGFLPLMWRKLAPQTEKNLSNWIMHFEKRFAQYKAWNDNDEPLVMWLSGLHIPESYLTALVQTTCRAKGWALDKSTLYTVVTKHTNPAQITERLAHGCYIKGLYLEGARWDIKRNCLSRQL
jgi:dynein heavy chain, axonemal